MVNFPVDCDDFKNTKEGGMFVELWVSEKKLFDCGICCGYGNIYTIMCESLIGTDFEENKDNWDEVVNLNVPQKFPLEEKLFPHIKNNKVHHQYNSFNLLACVTMGSTGWSGWHEKNEKYWRCSYKDLNEDGKNIYNIFKKMYDCNLLLVTWLDT